MYKGLDLSMFLTKCSFKAAVQPDCWILNFPNI